MAERDEKKVPFSVAQARRDLRDAERTLRDLEKRKIQGPARDDAEDEVKRLRNALKDMTSGAREGRVEAREEFMRDYYNELGGPWVAELVKRDEELRKIFEKAVRTDDLDGFMDDLYQSKWWKDPKKSGSWKQAFRLEFAKDKTQWRDTLADAKLAVQQAADDAYNMEIPEEILNQVARRYLYEGWARNDNRGLRTWLASQFERQQAAPGATTPGGALRDVERSLREAARSYGVTRDQGWARQTAERVLNPEADFDEDDAWNELINEAESKYPVFAGRLSKDRSVRDLAAGYIGELAQLLEIRDPNLVDLSDPLLQKAFTSLDEKNQPRLMPLWEFNRQVKKDERWQYTDNAHQSYSNISNSIGRMMGFVS